MSQGQYKKKVNKKLRGMLRLFFSRTTIIFVAVFLQVCIMFYTIQWLSDYSTFVNYGFLLLGVLVAIHIMGTNTNSSFKMAWLVPVLLFPIFGSVFYVFMYNQFDTYSMKKRLEKIERKVQREFTQDRGVLEALKNQSGGEYGLAEYLHNVGRFPAYRNCRMKFFPLGEDKYQEMLVQLKQAKHFIFLEYFIVSEGQMWDSILEILKEKAAEGVEVRFMYDGMCSLGLLPYGYYKKIRRYGIQATTFSQLKPALSSYQNNRDHRKILVIDGRVAFTGGVNLADEYINEYERFGHWKDTAIMVEGPAVRSFTLMFLKMWNVANKVKDVPHEEFERYLRYTEGYACNNALTKENIDDIDTEEERAIEMLLEESQIEKAIRVQERMAAHIPAHTGGFVIPYSDDPFTDERIGKQVYIDILNRARHYVHIMTPYLILDDEMAAALTYSAKRGVETVIIMPHIPDKMYAYLLARTYYKDLLENGVKIYEYTPGFVHAKVFVSDDIRGVVGTSNLDFRSLYLHFECCMYIYNNDVVFDMEADYQNTLAKCQQITIEDCEKYPFMKKVAGRLLRFVAPLM